MSVNQVNTEVSGDDCGEWEACDDNDVEDPDFDYEYTYHETEGDEIIWGEWEACDDDDVEDPDCVYQYTYHDDDEGAEGAQGVKVQAKL